METVKYCSPGVFRYTVFFTVFKLGTTQMHPSKEGLLSSLHAYFVDFIFFREYIRIVKPALVTTCIQRPPLFKDHLVVSQLWLYHAFLPLLRDHLYSKITFFGPAWLLNTGFTDCMQKSYKVSPTTKFAGSNVLHIWPKAHLIQCTL